MPVQFKLRCLNAARVVSASFVNRHFCRELVLRFHTLAILDVMLQEFVCI